MIDVDSLGPLTPENEDIPLAPGVEYRLGADEYDMSTEEVAAQGLFGFEASLKAEVNVGNCFVYIFDRGENASYASYAAVPATSKNTELYPDDRYIIITDDGINDLNTAVNRGADGDTLVGWAYFAAGEELVLGANETSSSVLNDGLNESVSENHLRIQFGEDGSIGLTDLGSLNGSRIIKQRETATDASPDTADFTSPDDLLTPEDDDLFSLGNDDFDLTPPDEPLRWTGIVTEPIDLDADMADILNAGLGDLEYRAEREPILDLGIAEKPLKGEDSWVAEPSIGLYAVFDGVGGHAGGDIASRTAAEVVNRNMAYSIAGLSEIAPDAMESHLIHALKRGNTEVRSAAPGGGTTAVATVLHEYRGEKWAVWASVGDSRLYIFNDFSGTLNQITEDEILSPEKPNVITNSLGFGADLYVGQSGAIRLSEGDRLILCSDGITGDKGTDVLENYEVIAAVQGTDSNQQAAQNLIDISRKRDDKTALVVGLR